MSIKKLAKSINNLADAIRYHADGGKTNLPKSDVTFSGSETPFELAADAVRNAVSKMNAPRREGTISIIPEAAPTPPAPLTEAEENFVDPYDVPPKVNGPDFMAGFDAGLVPAFQTSDGKSLNDTSPPVVENEALTKQNQWPTDAPPPPPLVENDPTVNDAPDFSEEMAIDNTNPVDAPGWQTLTVEELDAQPPSKFGQAVEAAVAAKVAPPPPQSSAVEDLDRAPSTPSEKEAEPSEYDVSFAPEVDDNGLPWDERIHSSGKTLLVDGTWRLKRGVPDDEYAAVVAELEKLMAIPAPVDNTPPPPPSAEAPTPPAPSATVDNLPAFIKAVTGAKIPTETVQAAVKNAGLENVMQLGARPDLIAGIAKELGL